jgi:anti-anti-sigma factor
MIDYEAYKADGSDDTIVMVLEGNLDATTSEFLLDCLQGHIDDGITKAILDCGKLEYVSSLGLGTMVRANARLKKHGGRIALTNVHGLIADAIRVVHLDRLFNIYPNIEEATQALA